MEDNPIKDSNDVNALMWEMLAQVLENGLEGELEELNYTKYDYRNQETDNSNNGYMDNTLHTSYSEFRTS